MLSVCVSTFIGIIDLGNLFLTVLVHGKKDRIDLRLHPIIAFFRLRRADVQQQRQACYLPQELQNSDCQFSSVSRDSTTMYSDTPADRP
jgi:hypothetical protein